MKPPSTELFDLIKSLNKNEKGYFKKYTSSFHNKSDSIYEEVFDTIENQKEYNEELLLKNFKGKDFINHFSVIKVHLQKHILKSLRGYYSEKSSSSSIYEKLQYIEILFYKGFYKTALRFTNQIIEIAQQKNYWELLLEGLRWKEIIELNINQKQTDITEATEHALQEIQSISKLSNQKRLIIERMIAHGPGKQIQKSSEFKEVLKYGLSHLKSDYRRAKEYYYVLAYYFRFKGEEKKAFDAYMSGKAFLEKKKLEPHELYWYGSFCVNLIALSPTIGKQKYIDKITNDFKNQYDIFVKHNKNLIIPIEIIYLSILNVNIYIKNSLGLKQDLENTVKEGQARMASLKRYLPVLNIVQMNYAYCIAYFRQHDYKNALDCIDEVLQYDDIREDLNIAARMVQMILHYELKNFRYLEHLIQSNYRLFLKKKQPFEFERVFVKFFNQLSKVTEKKELKKLFSDTLSDFEKIKTDASSQRALSYFNYTEWLQTKIDNRK